MQRASILRDTERGRNLSLQGCLLLLDIHAKTYILTSIMMRKYLLFSLFLGLFFLVLDAQEIFAFPKKTFPQEQCANALLVVVDKSDPRFTELSPEAQNMIQMASLIAQTVAHSNNTLPAKVNTYHILLAALIEVQSADESMRNLNLMDMAEKGGNKNTLFIVLKDLDILRNVQNFLLEKIGLNRNDPDPFQFQSDGSLLLHLNDEMIFTTIDYDPSVDRLWRLAVREKETEIKYNRNKSGRSKKHQYGKPFEIPTFPEHFFFAALSVEEALLYFLSSEHFDGKTAAQIKDILFLLIEDARRSHWNFSKKKRRNHYDDTTKAGAVAAVLKLESSGEKTTKAIKIIAEKMGIKSKTLMGWVYKYKSEHKLSRNQKTYSDAKKAEVVAAVLKLEKDKDKDITLESVIKKIAEQMDIALSTLRSWVYEYKKEHKLSKSQKTYSDAKKAEAVAAFLQLKSSGETTTDVEAIEKIAEQMDIPFGTLKRWVSQHGNKQ